MIRRRAALITTLVVLLVSSAPGVGAATATSAPRLSPVDQVYAHAARTLRALGVYHLTTQTIETAGKDTSRSVSQDWVDVSLNAARSVDTYTPDASTGSKSFRNTSLLADGIQWYDGRPATPTTCHHASAAADTVLGCPNPVEVAKSKVIMGRFEGKAALVLVTHAVAYGEDETDRTTTLTYLDPKTALPLGSSASGTRQSGTLVPLHITRTFQGERVRLTSLPAGFFTAASLGWKVPDPTKGLPHGLPVYWLGRTWSPGARLPDLVLQGVDRLKSTMPIYQEILEYAPAADRFGPAVLTIQVWTANAWAAAGAQFGIPLCKPVSHVTLPLADVTLYCSDQPNGVTADLSPVGAHLLINAPGYSSVSAGEVRSPYDSIAALERVINALQVRP